MESKGRTRTQEEKYISNCEISTTAKNTLLIVIVALYVSVFIFSCVHTDLARDISQAFRILSLESFPLVGPDLAGTLHLGPVWYYLLAVILWFTNSWLGTIIVLSIIAAVQFPLAYLLGKELWNKYAGVIFALLLAAPSWSYFEQIFPTHIIFASGLSIALCLCAARHAHNGKNKYLYLESICFSLALHAHPTTVIAIIPALYLNLNVNRKYHFSKLALGICLLLLLLPFSSMIYQQVVSGFPVFADIRNHTQEIVRAPDFHKLYKLPLLSLSGLNYIVNLGNGPSRSYLLYAVPIAIFLPVILLCKKAISKNTITKFFDYQSAMVFIIILFFQALILFSLSVNHPFHYVTALRGFILCVASFLVAWILGNIDYRKSALTFLSVTVLCSNILLVLNAKQWSDDGIISLNIFPLYDISEKYSAKIEMPASSAISESQIQAWLCQTDFSSLHGALAKYLIYDYAVETRFACRGKNIRIGQSTLQANSSPEYIGIPERIARDLESKFGLKPNVKVGSFRVLPVVVAIDSALIGNPTQGSYPPFPDVVLRQKYYRFTTTLAKDQFLSVANLAFEFRSSFDLVVKERDLALVPVASVLGMNIYLCHYCDESLITIDVDAAYRNRIDAVIF